MSDESEGAGAKADSALKPASGVVLGSGNIQANYFWFSPETAAAAAAVAIYCKAFLEALGKRSGEGVADLPKLVLDLTRVRKARKGNFERIVGIDDSSMAMIIVTDDLPDEALLALIDLDVTAEEVRGKTLRWDDTAGAWLPDEKG